MTALTIEGPAGVLAARHDEPEAARQALLCHPHPQYGGNMDDPVLDELARVLLGHGFGVLRFNFRGVGGSAGEYGGGPGEVDDLLAAAAWLRERRPAVLWAGGYSFGAWVVWNALSRGLSPARAVLLAPPLGAMPFETLAPECPVDVVAGTADSFVNQALLADWDCGARHPIQGGDHFFSGRHRELRAALQAICAGC